jgi:hypothetical protein
MMRCLKKNIFYLLHHMYKQTCIINIYILIYIYDYNMYTEYIASINIYSGCTCHHGLIKEVQKEIKLLRMKAPPTN